MSARRPSLPGFVRRRPLVSGGLVVVAVAALLFFALFDWDRLRPPLERLLSERLQRTVQAQRLDVDPGWTIRARITGLRIGNPPGFDEPWLAQVGELSMAVAISDLLVGRVLLKDVRLDDADVVLRRLGDRRDNWTLTTPDPSEPKDDGEPPALPIQTLRIDDGRLRFRDDPMRFDLDLRVDTVDQPLVDEQGVALPTRLRFDGHYERARFEGEALTGDVLSLQQTGQYFPLRGQLRAGTTTLSVNGRIADLLALSGIDARVKIQGQTLGNLYPFLLLPLPATPPYELAGRLAMGDGRYALTEIDGRIGSTDIGGEARYTQRSPRPLLEADLNSRLLSMADLGPLIGVRTKDSPPAAGGQGRADRAYDQQNTATRERAKAAEKANSGERVLPDDRFDPARLRAIDADVKLKAGRMKLSDALPLETFDAGLRLDDGRLQLEPFRFGFAGGRIDAQARIDGRSEPMASTLRVDARALKVDRLVPDSPTIAQGAGAITGRLQLAGQGASIAEVAAHANGSLAAMIEGGEISNLLDAAAGLNGGKILTLLLGGDRDIRLRCGGASFDIADGIGRSTTFVVDTEQTQILGEGGFDLREERFDLRLEPRPKSPGILSLRTPVQLFGPFRDPDFKLEKAPLAARLGGALALAAVAPPAALLALIETGPGETTDCQRLLRETRRPMAQPPKPPGQR